MELTDEQIAEITERVVAAIHTDDKRKKKRKSMTADGAGEDGAGCDGSCKSCDCGKEPEPPTAEELLASLNEKVDAIAKRIDPLEADHLARQVLED